MNISETIWKIFQLESNHMDEHTSSFQSAFFQVFKYPLSIFALQDYFLLPVLLQSLSPPSSLSFLNIALLRMYLYWLYLVTSLLHEKCPNTEFFLVRIFPHSY